MSLAQAGADVAITYRGSAEEAAKTRDELTALGVRALAVQCDVRDVASVRSAVGEVHTKFGRLDLLVNNAGLFETAALETISVDSWNAMYETNTRGPFLMAQACYPYLKTAQGRIVNIGSLGGMHACGHACALLYVQGSAALVDADHGEGVGPRRLRPTASRRAWW